MQKLIILLTILLSSSFSFSQTFLETLDIGADRPSLSFAETQRAFLEWSKGRDLSQEKGWKWFKRWEHFESVRMSPDGSLYDPADYAHAVAQVIAEKNSTSKASATGNWLPYGPAVYPTPNFPTTEPGLGRINCITFHPTDANTFWVGVAQGGVWKTVDSGVSWTPLTDNLPTIRISDIAIDPAHPDTMYVSLGDYAYFGAGLTLDDRKRHTHYGIGVYKTTNGGSTWAPTGLSFQQTDFDFSLTRRVMVDANNSNELIAVGTHGVWKSLDGGSNWNQVNDSLYWDLERHPNNPDILYASTGYRSTLNTGSAGIMKSTDFGDTWTTLNSGIPTQFQVQRIELTISPVNPDIVYALCANSQAGFYGLYQTTNGGNSWAQKSSSPNILHWGDGAGLGGQGWYDLTILAHPTQANTIYTGGVNMWGSTDGGVTWDGISYWRNTNGPSIHADQHYLAFNPLDNSYYMCNDGGLYRTANVQIGSWTDVNNNPNYTWPTVWEKLSAGMICTSFYRLSTSADNPGYVITGAQDNGTYFYNPITNEWRNVYGGDGMDNILHPTDPDIFYCSSQYGNLVSTTDGGANINYGLAGGIGENGEWVTPYVMHPTNFATIYAGYGNVFKSTTGGNTWTQLSTFPVESSLGQPSYCSSIAVAASNPNYIYAAKRFQYSVGVPASFWVTTNDGSSWTDRTAGLPDSLYYTHIAVDSDDPATAWVSVGGFVNGVKVFKTTDAGASWQNFSQNLPNLPVNAVVHNPDGAFNGVYIGMDVGVYYTNDTMSGWNLYANDLPNVIVSDLDIHRSEQKIYISTFGRGVWRADLLEIASHVDEPLARAFEFDVFPNPSAGAFTVRMDQSNKPQARLEVINVLGETVLDESVQLQNGQFQRSYDLQLGSGIYFVKASFGKETRSRKIVVNR